MDDVLLVPLGEDPEPGRRSARASRRGSRSSVLRAIALLVAVAAAFVIGRASSDGSSNALAPTTSTSPPITRATVTAPSSTTTTSSVVPGVAGVFAGQWSHHSMSLGIDPGGHGLIMFRTYADCASDPQPCDVLAGSGIYSGGLTTFTITGDGNDAVGEITSSTDPVAFPLGPFTARYDSAQDLLILQLAGQDPLGMCGPRANAYTADPPCGA